MSINVVITGPESSGKTQLAKRLSEKLVVPLVTEVARDYLSELRGDYLPSDLLTIAELQTHQESVALNEKGFVADTDQQVLAVWWQEKYGPLPRHLAELYRTQSKRFYLLCYPDLPWESDALRESEHDRQRLFNIYVNDLEKRKLRYEVIMGLGETRTQSAFKAIANYKESSTFWASKN